MTLRCWPSYFLKRIASGRGSARPERIFRAVSIDAKNLSGSPANARRHHLRRGRCAHAAYASGSLVIVKPQGLTLNGFLVLVETVVFTMRAFPCEDEFCVFYTQLCWKWRRFVGASYAAKCGQCNDDSKDEGQVFGAVRL
jgi:hypothetical protein